MLTVLTLYLFFVSSIFPDDEAGCTTHSLSEQACSRDLPSPEGLYLVPPAVNQHSIITANHFLQCHEYYYILDKL